MKKTLFLACAFIAGVLFATECTAAEDVVLIGSTGYANIQRDNAWNPIVIKIQNNGGPIDGILEVVTGEDGQNITSRDINIGEGPFLFNMYYYCGVPCDVEVKLRRGRKLVAQPMVTSPMDVEPGTFVCLVVGKTAGLMKLKSDKEILFQPAYISDPREMPDSWIGYDFADFVLFAHSDLSRLKSEQEGAIRNWLIRGGRIGIVAGKNWQYIRDCFLSGILPVEITGTKEVSSIDAFRGLSIAHTQPGDKIIAATVDHIPSGSGIRMAGQDPIVMRFRYGRGEVFLFNIDPGDEVFRKSPDYEKIWLQTFGLQKVSAESENYNYEIPNHFRSLISDLSSIRGVRNISIGTLTLIFLVYIIVIGPFDYFLLKKLRKLSWTHLTFVFYVLIFSVFAYYYTYQMKGGDMWIRKFVLADLPTEGDQLMGSTTMMVFSPQNNTYEFPVNASTAIRPSRIDQYSNYGHPGMEREKGWRLSLSDSGNEFHYPISIWSSEYLRADWMVPAPGDVTCTLHRNRNWIAGEIFNELKMDINEGILLYDKNMYRFGEIRRGAKINISNINKDAISNNRHGYSENGFMGLALFMTIPRMQEIGWRRSSLQASRNAIDNFRELKFSNMTDILTEDKKAVLILECSGFDDGIHVKDWDSARTQSFVYLRKIINVEN